ncbi:T9SS type A sorting domain-containing protein [Hymenobacter rubidus]|uniref:T9SS type A sorting domain-containing protein n=1 Tax=Hymenobacter rubidus TaxID=1441626 RepID=UPI00191E5D41|nr:T9SS type A sorting domain-containing protein [Hymenobacter rubidus]
MTTRYRLTLENVGTTTVPAGTATLALDSHITYISSTPSGTVAGQTITLNYAALAPFGQSSYDVLFSLPINTAIGTALSTIASAPLTGDVVPADNTATLAQTVVGAYDPNSIEVNYDRLTPTQVAAQQPLDYTIHFQNLGTASAQNVILSDTLDFRKLNLASLMLVSQSHSCIWSLTSTGPNTGQLTVRFLGINLPERNVDVIRSQGFVRFRVQPKTTLAVGEIIPNRAGIVFDYNAPVLTNTATTTVFLATAALTRPEAPAWTAYPNPATDAITLTAELATAGPVRVELLDMLGRPVRQQTLTAPAGPLRQTVDLRGLAAGVYVLRLTPPTGPATSRQVVRN